VGDRPYVYVLARPNGRTITGTLAPEPSKNQAVAYAQSLAGSLPTRYRD